MDVTASDEKDQRDVKMAEVNTSNWPRADSSFFISGTFPPLPIFEFNLFGICAEDPTPHPVCLNYESYPPPPLNVSISVIVLQHGTETTGPACLNSKPGVCWLFS